MAFLQGRKMLGYGERVELITFILNLLLNITNFLTHLIIFKINSSMPPLPAAVVSLLKSDVTPKIPGSILFQRHAVPENRYFFQAKRAMQMSAGRGWLPFQRWEITNMPRVPAT